MQWTIPLDFANNIPKQSTGWGTIYCDTYYGSTLIGTKSVGFSASAPNSLAPTVSVSLTRPRTTSPAVTGYIQNIDSLKVAITAAGKYSATITGYSSTVDGIAYVGSTFTTGILSKAGTIKVTVTATDSRGKQTTVNREITVTSYSPPAVTGINAYRCKALNDATADAGGGYICITPKGTITSLSNMNAKKCIVYWKKVSDSAWQSKELAMSAYTLSGYIIVSADTASSYNICARLQDSFKTIDHYGADIMSAAAFIDILMASSTDITKKGLGIGKTAEKEGTLDLGWDLILRGGVRRYGICQSRSAARTQLMKEVMLQERSGKDKKMNENASVTYIKGIFTAVFSVLTSLFGVLAVPILLMVGANVIDYATGLIAAPKRSEDINSYKSMRGIWKKVCMWLLVAVGAIIDELILYASGTIGITLPGSFLVACIVACWIICNEVLSILENLKDIGVALPPFLEPLMKNIKSQVADKMPISEKKDNA